MRSWRRSITLVLLVTVRMASAQTSDLGELVVCGSGDHFWFIQKAIPQGDGYQLFHHGRNAPGPFYQPFHTLSVLPQRMVSWEQTLWFLFPKIKTSGREVLREIYSLQAEYHAPLQSWQPSPEDHLKKEPSLTSLGHLVDLIGTPGGLVALLVPTQWSAASVRGGERSLASSPVLDGPKLLQLQGMQWIELDLPPDAQLQSGSFLSTVGRRGQELAIVSPKVGSTTVRVCRSRAGGGWRTNDIDVGPLPIQEVVPIGEQIAFIQRDDDAGLWRVSVVRSIGLLPLGQIPFASSSQTAFTTLGGNLHIVSRSPSGRVSLSRMASLSGKVGKPVELEPQSIPLQAIWQIVITTLLLMILVYVAVSMKPNEPDEVNLPAHFAPFPLMSRFIALLIDLLPGGVLAVLVFDCDVPTLLRHPIISGSEPAQVLPFLFMVSVTMIHSMISEWLASTTLGKVFFGALVLNVSGQRPASKQLFKRNFFKFLVLLVPPLGVLMFRNPYRQGLGEIKSRTVVVHRTDDDTKT